LTALPDLLARSLTDHALVLLDGDGKVHTWPAAAARITGWHRQELPEPFIGAAAREQAAAQGRFAQEGWRPRKDGSSFWASLVVTPLREDDGTLAGFAAVLQDLTERHQAIRERALLQSVLEGEIQIRVDDRGPRVVFEVSDDGPGIPAQYHARIFEMFQRLRSRDEVEGSGIGLTLVKKIVDTAGGAVAVESSGRGATFRVEWPRVWPRRG
jgi:PAS domain S-box-containing protein